MADPENTLLIDMEFGRIVIELGLLFQSLPGSLRRLVRGLQFRGINRQSGTLRRTTLQIGNLIPLLVVRLFELLKLTLQLLN